MATQNSKVSRRKKALGRGLGALIPKQSASASASERAYFECALDKIRPNAAQPRKRFDQEAIDELAASIRESGLIQPLVVRPLPGEDGVFEIIAGERRWRASRQAGLKEVPIVVKDVSDAVAFALALIENIQRRDLDPIEEALAYQRLMEEFEFTQQYLAEQVGKSRSAIANSVRLLGLPEAVQRLLAEDRITSGHARALLGIHEESVCVAAAQRVLDEQWTVRQTEAMVRALKGGRELDDVDVSAKPEAPTAPSGVDAAAGDGVIQVQAVEPASAAPVAPRAPERLSDVDGGVRDDMLTQEVVRSLEEHLGVHIELQDERGVGRLEIHYGSYESLQSILERMGVQVEVGSSG